MGKFDELTDPKVVPLKKGAKKQMDLPEGYDIVKSKRVTEKRKTPVGDPKLSELKLKKAWELATAPAKSLPMNMFMSYMTGNSLQLIPIMMTFMLVWNPLKSIFKDTNKVMGRFTTEDNKSSILALKAIYVFCQILNMALGVWKLDKMGLVPHREGDWLAWKSVIQLKEHATIF